MILTQEEAAALLKLIAMLANATLRPMDNAPSPSVNGQGEDVKMTMEKLVQP